MKVTVPDLARGALASTPATVGYAMAAWSNRAAG
jgi:hypothetical protein